jgi:hypothetical protein
MFGLLQGLQDMPLHHLAKDCLPGLACCAGSLLAVHHATKGIQHSLAVPSKKEESALIRNQEALQQPGVKNNHPPEPVAWQNLHDCTLHHLPVPRGHHWLRHEPLREQKEYHGLQSN